jgi:hypothetical protein
MICADFLAGANLENGNPELLLHSSDISDSFLKMIEKLSSNG